MFRCPAKSPSGGPQAPVGCRIFRSPDHAGHSLANLAVGDIDVHVAALRDRGVETGDIVEVNKGVRVCSIIDPDGNTITIIGNFREQY